jgi:hypothetical protein
MRSLIIECGISERGTSKQKQLCEMPARSRAARRLTPITALLYSFCAVLVMTGLFPRDARADYLDMMLSPVYQGIQVQMNYKQGKTYRVEWSIDNSYSATGEVEASNCYGAPNTCLYTTSNLQCNTTYHVRAKWKGRAWRYGSVRTQCGVPCPRGGWFDGANCQIGTPPAGTTAFIWGGNYYYTPLPPPNRCPYPGSWFDTANCFVQAVPPGVQPFIWANYWYYKAYP